MKNKVYALYDSKAESFGKPIFYRSRGEAVRAFQDALKDSTTTFSKYPEDFTLFEIGEYEELTASMLPYEAKQSIGNGIELRQ